MKNQRRNQVNYPIAMPSFKEWPGLASSMKSVAQVVLIMLFMLAASLASAQGIRFQFTTHRATVPLGTTNSSAFVCIPTTNNTVILVNGVTNAMLDVSGLPAGAGAVVADTNGVPLSQITNSTAVWVTVNSTNLPEGIYNFSLNASGFDTNGMPVTNNFPFVLQAAHLWNGAGLGVAGFGVSNNWASASSWLGGLPDASSDVVFGDYGGQTNNTFSTGISFTNISIDASVTVGSLRFAQGIYTNDLSTNGLTHTIRLAQYTTLTVTGSNGFSLLRDYVSEFGYDFDRTMTVNILGTNATLLVSNANANFNIAVGSSLQPTLSISNLGTFVASVNRMGLSDYQLYPNYRAINGGYNGGRDVTNYSGLPRRMWNNVYLARTNFITATYKDPDNYDNEFTRSYAIMLQNNEQSGNGSGTSTILYFGITNVIKADSICFIGASSASGNNGGVRFNFMGRNCTNPTAYFRGTDGTSRMSLFCVADDGGTNMASSNVKATVDFTGAGASTGQTPQGYIDLLADRLIIARDRTMITSNQSPNVQGDLTIGNGIVDVNTMILGFQEHSNKLDWPTIGGAQPYLNYCRGSLVLTNGGYRPTVVKVNRNLILGYTADNNPVGSAQQYNTYGRITLYSNVTMMVSNIICDGGLNYYDNNGRQNTITLNRGANLIISNTIGAPSGGANDFSAADPAGIRLDALSMAAGTLTVNLDPSRANVYTRSLSTSGTIPSVIKVAGISGVSGYPVRIPVISYQGSASPFLTADVSALGAGFYGYVLNDSANNTVDVYITTNQPNDLVWTGNINNEWDITTRNWVTKVGGIQTNFSLGDIVTFGDSASVTNVNITDSVVPSQSGVGITISNSLRAYHFTGGTVAGTALVVKLGTNSVQFDANEQGPINIQEGSLFGAGSLGAATLWSNTVLNTSGNINGGLNSTGTVFFAGSSLAGPVSIRGGSLVNSGTINTLQGNSFLMGVGVMVSNSASGTINLGTTPVSAGAAWDVPYGSTLVNMGEINLWQNRITVEGSLYGTGTISDPNGGGYSSGQLGLVRINPLGVFSPGSKLENEIAKMNLYTRFDWENDPNTSPFGMGTVRIDVDFSHPQTNDIINCDRWNNDAGYLIMTNINPGAGQFANGQTFTIFNNTSGRGTNYIDTAGFSPIIQPYLPGPGLVWNITNFNVYGVLGVVTNSMVWDGTSTATWVTNSPSVTAWKTAQPFQDAQGALFDDTASGSTMVNLVGTLSPAGYIAAVNTSNPSIFPGVVVNNSAKDYVFAGSGSIAGATSIYKKGTGTLTLLTSNSFNGSVVLQQGTLVVSNNGSLVNIASLGYVGNGTGASGQNKNDVIFDGGAISFVGTTNSTLNNYTVFNPAGATVSVASPTNMLTMSKAPVGLGGMVKTGPGTLQLNGGNAVFAGDVTVANGTLRLNAANAVGAGSLILNSDVTLETTNINLALTNDLTVAGAGVVFNFRNGCTNLFSGNWSGAGAVTFSNANPFVFNGSLTNFSGSISFGPLSANYGFNNKTNSSPCIGSVLAAFDLGTGSSTLSNLNGGGLTYHLGALSGGSNTILAGRSTNSIVAPGTTYSIGANGASTVFAGKIADGLDTVTVIKVGGGTLLLNGNNTYTGPTTVSNGVLGGVGSLASALTVTAGATFAPGAPVGKFTVNNNATLNGATVMEIDQSSAATNDQLVVTGTLTVSGPLLVTNVGPMLTNGATFKLFSKAVTGFSSVTLPAGGYVWNNTLGTDGAITLVSGGISPVNPNPTNIVTSVQGKTLTLSWPMDHIGWQLQVQTNDLGVGLSTNWFPVGGSKETNSVDILMDPANGSVFFRLILVP